MKQPLSGIGGREKRGDEDDFVEQDGIGEGDLFHRLLAGVEVERDVVELVAAFHQAADDANEIAAHGVADAAVIHFEDFLIGIDDEFVVGADFAELVFDHGDAESVVFREDAVEQRGFTGAEKSCEDGDGEFVSHGGLVELFE
jgi:hypothetical protein